MSERELSDISRLTGGMYIEHPRAVMRIGSTLDVKEDLREPFLATCIGHDTIEKSKSGLIVENPFDFRPPRDKSVYKSLIEFGESGLQTTYMLWRVTHPEKDISYLEYMQELFNLSDAHRELDLLSILVKCIDNYHNFGPDEEVKGRIDDPQVVDFNNARAQRASSFVRTYLSMFERTLQVEAGLISATRYSEEAAEDFDLYSTQKVRDLLLDTTRRAIKVMARPMEHIVRDRETTKRLLRAELYVNHKGSQFGSYRKNPFPSNYRRVIDDVIAEDFNFL